MLELQNQCLSKCGTILRSSRREVLEVMEIEESMRDRRKPSNRIGPKGFLPDIGNAAL